MSIISATISGTSKAAQAGFAWWCGELLSFVPRPISAALFPERSKLLIEIRGQGLVKVSWITPDGIVPDRTTKVRTPTGDPDIDEAYSLTDLGAAAEDVIVSLPETCGERGTVHLPASAREDIEGALSRMTVGERYAPGTVYVTHGPAGRTGKDGTFPIDFIAAPRRLVDECLKAVRTLGLEPDRLVIGLADEPWADLLPPDAEPLRPVTHLVRRVFVPLAAALALAALVYPFARQELAIYRASQAVAALEAAAPSRQSLLDQIKMWEEATKIVAAHGPARAAFTELLATLSGAIPGDTHLSEIEFGGGRVALAGLAANALLLQMTLERLPQIESVKFEEPVVRDEVLGQDRFRVSARLSDEEVGKR